MFENLAGLLQCGAASHFLWHVPALRQVVSPWATTIMTLSHSASARMSEFRASRMRLPSKDCPAYEPGRSFRLRFFSGRPHPIGGSGICSHPLTTVRLTSKSLVGPPKASLTAICTRLNTGVPASAQGLRGLSAEKSRGQDRGVTARPAAPLSLRGEQAVRPIPRES